MKKMLFLTSLLLLSSLTACDNNPLKKIAASRQIAAFLQASRSAEKAMQLHSFPGGGYYLSCMTANESKIDCEQFFKHMLGALKQIPDFETVTVEALKDRTLFNAIAVDYQNAFFNAIDE